MVRRSSVAGAEDSVIPIPDAVKAGGRMWSRKQRRMACPPLAERDADYEQVVARRRELVVIPAPVGLGCRLDDTEPFELWPLESRVRESPGAPSRISLKFPQPRYRLRMISGVQRSAKIGPRARAVLAVRPHNASVAHPPLVVKSRFLTSQPPVRRGAMEAVGGTTPDDEPVGGSHETS